MGTRAFYEIRGVPPEALNQPDVTSLVDKRVVVGQHRVTEATRDFLLGFKVPPPIYRAVHPDGSEHVLIVSARKVRDQKGQVVELRGTLTDITDHPNVTSVALYANDALTSMGLRSAFEGVEWGRVVTDGPCRAMSNVPAAADIAIVALEPGDMDALAAMRRSNPIKVIAILDRRYSHLLPELLELEVEAVLTAEKLSERLPVALLAVRTGERYISPTFIESVMKKRPEAAPAAASGDDLTDVELKVLRMLSVGLRNEEIARKIYVSLPTVKRCTQRIYLKLGARDRAQAVDIAHRRRLV